MEDRPPHEAQLVARAKRGEPGAGMPESSGTDDGLRIAENVLLLERGPPLIRLEGAFDRARALELARSLR